MERREFIRNAAGAAIAAGVSTALPAFGFSSLAQSTSTASSPFHFSVMLWTIERKLGMDATLDILHGAGYEGAELVGEYNDWDDATARKYVSKMRSLGLRFDSMAGVKTGFATPGAGNALHAEIEKLLVKAEKLECPQIILLSGPRAANASHKQQHAASVENLKRIAELGEKHKVEFVIEPIDALENPTIYLTSVVEGFEIVRSVGSPQVRVLYDFYHEQRGAGNLIEKLDGNIDLISLVHIADVPGRHEPGTGEIDYGNIYRQLAKLGYSKFVAMEFYPTGDPRAALEKARLEVIAAVATARSGHA